MNTRGGGGGQVTARYDTRAPIFLYTTHCHDLLYRTVWFHENNHNGIQNRGHCNFNHQGKITQKV